MMLSPLRILYADADVSLRSRVGHYFMEKPDVESIHLAQSGAQLLRKMEENNYNLVIMDLQISEVKDFDFFDHIRQINPDISIIVTTKIGNDTVVRRLSEKVVDYTMLKPFNIDSLYTQIKSIHSSKQKRLASQTNHQTVEKIDRIREMLRSLGISEQCLGFAHLLAAVQIVHEDRSTVNGITYKLYPKIAEICQTNKTKVERTIRQTIEVSWRNGNLRNFNPRSTPNSMHLHDKPANAEFIAMIADQLMLDK